MKKLLVRTISGAVYVALVVFSIYSCRWLNNHSLGYVIFVSVFFAVAMIGMYEFYHNLELRDGEKHFMPIVGFIIGAVTYLGLTFLGSRHLIHFGAVFLPALWFLAPLCQLWRKDDAPFRSIGNTLLPVMWVVVPIYVMQLLGNFSLGLLLMTFICIWVNDSGAYLSGMLLGKHKMWVRHSPNKTWEGTIGGVLLCVAVAVFVGPLLEPLLLSWYWVCIGLICGIVGTLGDLVESMFKRSCGVKDSGNIMPGHGGILDRFDSILMAMPFVVAFMAIGYLL